MSGIHKGASMFLLGFSEKNQAGLNSRIQLRGKSLCKLSDGGNPYKIQWGSHLPLGNVCYWWRQRGIWCEDHEVHWTPEHECNQVRLGTWDQAPALRWSVRRICTRGPLYRRASQFHPLEHLLVPGLVQTRKYARLGATNDLSKQYVERFVPRRRNA